MYIYITMEEVSEGGMKLVLPFGHRHCISSGDRSLVEVMKVYSQSLNLKYKLQRAETMLGHFRPSKVLHCKSIPQHSRDITKAPLRQNNNFIMKLWNVCLNSTVRLHYFIDNTDNSGIKSRSVN